MALPEQIAAADTRARRPIGSGDLAEARAEALLGSARLDVERDEADLATRAVHRLAGPDAPLILQALGLTGPPPTPDPGPPPQTTPAKRCRRCGEVKPLTGFYADRRRADGHGSYCKPCQKILIRQARR